MTQHYQKPFYPNTHLIYNTLVIISFNKIGGHKNPTAGLFITLIRRKDQLCKINYK